MSYPGLETSHATKLIPRSHEVRNPPIQHHPDLYGMAESTREVASFLSLPLELQHQILTALVQVSPESIQALLYVSRTVYNIALPLSVHTFRNVTPRESPSKRPRPNLGFLRYITIAKPFLASKVRRIIVEDFGTAPRGEQSKKIEKRLKVQNKVREPERGVYRALVESTFTLAEIRQPRLWIREWFHDLDRGNDMAELALLLAACPNLQDLFIGEAVDPIIAILVVRVAAARAHLPLLPDVCMPRTWPLQNLRSVVLGQRPPVGMWNFDQSCEPFFRLPRLVSLDCGLYVGIVESWDGSLNLIKARADVFRPKGRGVSGVKHIALRAGGRALYRFTDECAALLSFEYSTRTQASDYVESMPMPRNVLQAVLSFAETLELLSIHFSGCISMMGNEWEEMVHETYLGIELREMRVLKTLKADMRAFTGILGGLRTEVGGILPSRQAGSPRLIECLPANLEYLEVDECTDLIADEANELLTEVRQPSSQFRRMTRVQFVFKKEGRASHGADLSYDA